MKALVGFATRFGTTEKVARALGAGLSEAGVETKCMDVGNVEDGSLSNFDLICLGAPTEMFSAYKPMKGFLEQVKGEGLSGKKCFAFDTKLDSRLSGSAAKFIEGRLFDLGLEVIAPRESAIVSNVKSGGNTTGAVLKEGEELRFKEIGSRIGGILLKTAPMPAQ